MVSDERTIQGHFGFDNSRRLKVTLDSPLELRMVIDHDDGSAYIAFEREAVQRLRDMLTEWLEKGRRAPIAAGRRRLEVTKVNKDR
jgi:hypothetical protein